MATERTITINLRKSIIAVPLYRRTKKAIAEIKRHLERHMKAKPENIRLGKYLNLKMWERGIKKPAHKITVLVKKDDKGIVTAELPNIPVKKQTRKQPKAKAAKQPEAKAAAQPKPEEPKA